MRFHRSAARAEIFNGTWALSQKRGRKRRKRSNCVNEGADLNVFFFLSFFSCSIYVLIEEKENYIATPREKEREIGR